MADIARIVEHAGRLLDISSFDDSSYNGLQVETTRPISRIAWAVTASAAALRKAADQNADMVVAHHGLYWKGQDPRALGGMYERLNILLRKPMGLAAFHLPLDAHLEYGNNAQIASRLGLIETKSWGHYHGQLIGMAGRTPDPVPIDRFVEQVATLVGRDVLHLPGGPDRIRSVAIVSGGAASMAVEAARDNMDVYITGEPTEWVTHLAAEEHIHVLIAGHHATEVFGVRALTEHLAERFDLELIEANVANPI